MQKIILLLAILLCGGKSVFAQWTPYATVTNSVIWNIAFADKNTVYAVGPGALMKSYDGGRSWLDLMLNVPTPDSNLYNLYFLNKDTGFVFSNDVDKNVFKTLDGGNIWTDVSQPALSVGLLDMQFVSSTVGYATCGYQSDSTLSKTTDGGLTWRRLKTPANCFAPMALHFLDELTGFSGENEIFKTADGGVSWQATTASPGWIPGHRISAYSFVDAQTGFAITDAWDLYKTGDGGASWSLVSLPFSANSGCRGVAFDQRKFGYITGFALDKLLISTDGGDSWNFDQSFPQSELPTCVAVSPDHKVIVGTREGDVVVKEAGPLVAVELAHWNGLKISPNPARGKILIHSSSPIQRVIIINELGQTFGSITPEKNGDVYELELSGYPRGLYFIKAEGEGVKGFGKIELQ